MSYLEGSEVIGASRGEVAIHRPRTDTRLKLRQGTLRSIATRLSRAAEERVYLALDGIRGTDDASVLGVYVRVPVDAPSDHYVKSLGLYGLSQASLGKGLTFVLDITIFFEGVDQASAPLTDEVLISVRLPEELSAGDAIIIGRILLLRKDDEAPRD